MKKYAAAFLAFIMLIASTISTNAYAAIASSGSRNPAGCLETVSYSTDGSSEAAYITVKNYTDYSTMKLSDPERIILDIYNTVLPGSQQVIKADGNIIKRIRYAQFEPHTARVVLDVNRETGYWVKKTDSGLILYTGEKTAEAATDQKAENSNASASIGQPLQSDSSDTDSGTRQNGISGESTQLQSNDVSNVSIKPDQSGVSSEETQSRQNPDSPADGKSLQNSTDSQRDPSQSGDAAAQTNSSRSGDSSGQGNSSRPANTNADQDAKLPLISKDLQYHNDGDRVHFILYDVELTKGDEFLEELYTGEYDQSGKKYTMTFATGQSDLGNGVMAINDKYLYSVEVKTNKAYGTTTLIFNGTGRNTYFAYTRGTSGVTSITVIRPADDAQKLVVIDAGHGGDASGAVYRNLLEKNLNLDIAKRLNELLKKKGVKTYMLREDDSSMGNYERAYIANHLNAKLYLSIHNNAMDNRNYRGTMTLYCPSDSNESFTGKSFAGIIQQTVLGSLKTIDRKVVSRPDLIVLKATNMPAALVEVGYLTNASDRSNIQKTSFRQKVAQALCDSIIKARSKVK